jgi:hypothetical protein
VTPQRWLLLWLLAGLLLWAAVLGLLAWLAGVFGWTL